MEQLRPALEAYDIDALRVIADTLGIETPASIRKNELVNELYRAIPAVAGKAEFIQGLSKEEQATLRILVNLDRICSHRDVAIPLIQQGMLYIRGIESTSTFPTLDTVLLSLLQKGLIVNVSPQLPSEKQRQFIPLLNFTIPLEVLSRLKVHINSVNDDAVSVNVLHEPSFSPQDVTIGQPEDLVRQLFFTWSVLRQKAARVLKSGSLSKRDQRRIVDSLGWNVDENPARLHLLYAILKTLNLVIVQDWTVDAVDNNAVTLFWSSSAMIQMREIVSAYVKLDLPLVYNTKPLSTFAYYGDLKTRHHSVIRKLILEIVESLASENWVPYHLFFALASGGTSGDLVLPPSSMYLLLSNLRWYGRSRKNELLEHLYAIEQQIVMAVLDEMSTLGFIDIVGQEQKKTAPAFIQVSDLLRAYLTHQPWVEPPSHGQVILQPDAQVLAMGPVPLRVLSNLERVLEREKQDSSVITYRITRESVYQALQRDETFSDIQGYLEEATGQPLPQNIARSLEEWAEQHERIIVQRDIQILQVATSDMLDGFMKDATLNRYLHRLDARTAWVRKKDTEAFEKHLRARDILLAHSPDRDSDLTNSLRWDGDLLVSRASLPSLYVVGALERFAESVSDDEGVHWKITAESLKRAISQGLHIAEILSMIETMTGNPLPSTRDKQLKAWGKFYGRVQTSEVRLVRLDSVNILRELRETDHNLKKWLQPLPGTEAVAVVKQSNWRKTEALLASYGIKIQNKVWW